MSITRDEDLEVLWGIEAIARAVDLLDADGNPNVQKCGRLLRNGHLPGDKVGDTWVSTRRRLRERFAGRTHGSYSQVAESDATA